MISHNFLVPLAAMAVSLFDVSAFQTDMISISTLRGMSPRRHVAFAPYDAYPGASHSRQLFLHSNNHACCARKCSDRRRAHCQCSTQLHATIDDTHQQSDIIERLELNQQFERWRFMQKLFEGELPPSDVEEILLLTLNAYLQHGPTAASANNKNENGGNASPVLTVEQRSMMSNLIDTMISAADGIGDSRFLHMLVLPPVDYESLTIDDNEEGSTEVEVDQNALSILEQIEQILPDPVEDEEAYKSAWDNVIDLYGRESVRVNEEALQLEKESRGSSVGANGLKYCAENLQWRTLCAIGRVLIHFDFLTKGVLKEGTFR